MIRLTLLFPVACLASACLSLAVPVPDHLMPKSVCYFPCGVGSKLVYEVDGVEGVETQIVTAVLEKEGAQYVTMMEEKKGRLVPYLEVKVSSEGVFRVGADGARDKHPTCLLKLPCKPGDTWENPMPQELKESMRVAGVEVVRVPAGTYRAIRIERSEPVGGSGLALGPSDVLRSTIWFAPDVGIVKFNSRDWDKVLKSFTPGPAPKQSPE